MSDRRQDGQTAAVILETLHMKRAFDEDAAMKLLRKQLARGLGERGAGWCQHC